jgi:hypothetical protein
MYHQQLKRARIRLSNDETVFGDIIDQNAWEFVVQLMGGKRLRIMRVAVVYIEEDTEAPEKPELQRISRHVR